MTTPLRTRPPRLAEAVLGWLLKDAWDTPLGDFEEYYHELETDRGVRWARWWYCGQVARLLPDRLYEKTYWSILMLKNFVVMAYRNLLKNRVSSAINLFGLSLAVACTMVAYLYVHSRIDNESFQKNGDTIFLVESIVNEDGASKTWGTTPVPLGPAMATDLPQVVRAVRMHGADGVIHRGKDEFIEMVRFVDPGFFDMFTFPLKAGSPEALADPEGIILNADAAVKYFGEEDPIGQPLTITFEGREEMTFFVRGVIAAYPRESSFRFSMLLPYDRQYALHPEAEADWDMLSEDTFIQVAKPGDIADLAPQMARYTKLQQAANPERPITAFTFDNLYDLSLHRDGFEHSFVRPIPWPPVIVLSVIATFLLALSCINYMNISLATVSRRLREIGIRKVVGSDRLHLIVQFLVENVLLCLIALILGLGIAHFFLVPAFNVIADSSVTMSNTPSADLLLFLACLLVGVGFVSGAYPAFYVSSFQPIAILTGKQRLGNRNRFMQSLLAVQFVLAFITMIACTGLVVNHRYELNRDWGYDQTHTLVVRLQDGSRYDVLHDEARRLPHVVGVSGSKDLLGLMYRWVEVKVDAKPVGTFVMDVDATYPSVMGLRLQSGRFFNPEHVSEDDRNVVVNATFVKEQGWTEPLGQQVRIDSTSYSVIGVVDDFHYQDFSNTIDPALLRLSDTSAFGYMSVRIEAGAEAQTMAALENVWHRLVPDAPFDAFFQNTVFDSFFRGMRDIRNIFIFTAVLALLISCMGLFGLAAQNTANRMKEISIRKVLGGSAFHLAHMMNRRFVVLMIVAALVATPLSYFGLNALLDSIYTYRMQVGPAPFLIAYGLIFITGLLTLSTQLYRLARTDPAETLRND